MTADMYPAILTIKNFKNLPETSSQWAPIKF